MRRVILILSGAATFLVVHQIIVVSWQSTFADAGDFAPWFLNSGKAILWMILAFAVVGFFASVFVGRLTARTWFDLGATTATGGAIPMIFILFTMRGGPGTIFPIVVVGGWLFLLAGSLIGAVAGWAGKWLVTRLGE
jgi:hypothetical protein